MKIDRHGRAKILTDVFDSQKRVRSVMMIRKGNTKGKLATLTIPVIEDLRSRLNQFTPPTTRGYLFPGRHGRGHIHSDSASRILREACRRVGIEGVSTHSFRRTALTQMSNAGVPIRVIQEISGETKSFICLIPLMSSAEILSYIAIDEDINSETIVTAQ